MHVAGRRDREELFGPVGLLLLDQFHIVQQGERGIDHAGARRIGAAGPFLDRTDEIVAVTGLLRDELEKHELQLARIEHASRSALAVPRHAPPHLEGAAPPPTAPAGTIVLSLREHPEFLLARYY